MTEYTLCEKPIIEALQSIGWKYVPGKELPRESYEEPLLVDILRDRIRELADSQGIELENEDVERTILRVKSPGAGPEGMKKMLSYLKDGAIPMKLGKKGLVYVPIIDREHPENNDFIVSNQVEFRSSGGIMKADIILFVNGIPLALIECKDPQNENLSWYDAYLDIKSYERRVPAPFTYVQFSVAASDIYDTEGGRGVRLFPSIPWKEHVRASIWRDESGAAGIDGLKEVLAPVTLLDLIRNFIFFTQEHGEDLRLFPRYMQYHAVKRIHSRILERMKYGNEDADRGLIWHWQGSGKTYTMIFAAYQAYTDPLMEKPSIFFVVDRKELQDQLWRVVKAMDLHPMDVEKVGSIRALREIIEHDGGRGKRGAFILLIQKFRPDEEQEEGISEEELNSLSTMLISERKNTLLLIDEGHRTQYGILAAQMHAIFKKAFMFAFTGTPISKLGKNTYSAFSPPGEAYLHRYFIEESIRDGYTVPIVYRFVKEWMEFRKEDFESLLEDVFKEESDEMEDTVARRFNTVNEILSNPELIRKKAAHIVESFMSRENKELKGMIVAANRKACVLYKKSIDEYLREHYPDEWDPNFAEIVMTYSAKEKEPEIEEYRDLMRKRHPALSFDQMGRAISSDFRDKKNPQILIVTDKLLAGFDAPMLQIMYMDKVMSGHNLLQAIARTNRPYEGKNYGLVIDYVGIFKRFKEALEQYYAMEDAVSIALDISQLEARLREALADMHELLGSSFVPHAINQSDKDAINQAISRIMEIEDGESVESRFIPLYREIMGIYELLGPSEIKVEPEIIEDIGALKSLYSMYRLRFARDIDPGKVDEYLKDVRQALYDSMKIEDVVGKSTEMVLDEQYIKMLKSIKDPDEELILDMTSVLNRYVMKIRENPWADTVYRDIIDSIENSIEKWRRRESDPESIKQEYLEIFRRINEKEIEKRSIPLDESVYPIFSYLKNRFGEEYRDDYVELISTVMQKLEDEDLLFPGWYEKAETRRKTGEEFRKALVALLLRKKIMDYADVKEIIDDVISDILSILETVRI